MANFAVPQIWKDGRSGIFGCAVGNIALLQLGEIVRREKGTVFSSDRALYVGRVVASDEYLSGSILCWANISWNQLRELQSEADSSNRSLYFLFVTGSLHPLGVRSWMIDASIVEQLFAQRGLNHANAVCAVHIVAEGDRQFLGSFDITSSHRVATLTSPQKDFLIAASTLAQGKDRESSSNLKQRERPTGTDSIAVTNSYDIPLTAGRHAQLRIARPVDAKDLERLKQWIDLFSDVLTEDAREESRQRAWLNEEVRAGSAQLDRGDTVDGEAAFERILARRRKAHQ